MRGPDKTTTCLDADVPTQGHPPLADSCFIEALIYNQCR